MDLWIRSQDKRRLVKANGVDITPSGLSIYSIGVNGILGTYETEERTLEVLDEIQSKLTLDCKINGNYQEMDLQIKARLVESQYGKIYEMPKE